MARDQTWGEAEESVRLLWLFSAKKKRTRSCPYACPQWGTIGDMKVWSFAALLWTGRILVRSTARARKKVKWRGLLLICGSSRIGENGTDACLARKIFGAEASHVDWRSVEIKQRRNAAIATPMKRLAWPDKQLTLRHRPDLLLIGEIRDTERSVQLFGLVTTIVTVFPSHAKEHSWVYGAYRLGVSEEELRVAQRGSVTNVW